MVFRWLQTAAAIAGQEPGPMDVEVLQHIIVTASLFTISYKEI